MIPILKEDAPLAADGRGLCVDCVYFQNGACTVDYLHSSVSKSHDSNHCVSLVFGGFGLPRTYKHFVLAPIQPPAFSEVNDEALSST